MLPPHTNPVDPAATDDDVVAPVATEPLTTASGDASAVAI
jgi:hypothetical protein